MKYYIVGEQGRLTLFKVADELVKDFEDEYKDRVIASANSMMEVLLAFQQVDDPRKEKEMEARPVKYKGGG